MAGNTKRPGATRSAGSKKVAQVGSGGKGRRALEGKGPTPKAEDRTYHVAHERKKAAEFAAAKAAPVRGRAKPKDRTSSSLELVVGRNSVLEALRMGMPAHTLHIFNRIEADERITELVALAVDAKITINEVPKPVLDRLSDGMSHQGVALEVPSYEYADVHDLAMAPRPQRIVVLDGIQDPRNLGAIMRSAAAFGASGVIIPERRAAGVTVAAWKVSAGAAARIPVARVVNLVRTIEDFKKDGFFAIGLDGNADISLRDSTLLDGPLLIVVGAEGAGLGRLVRESCDELVSIPIQATTESLNASVAASIALYEAKRAIES